MRFRMRSRCTRLKQSGPSGSWFLSPPSIFRSHWRAKEACSCCRVRFPKYQVRGSGVPQGAGRPKLRVVPGEVWETMSWDPLTWDSPMAPPCSAVKLWIPSEEILLSEHKATEPFYHNPSLLREKHVHFLNMLPRTISRTSVSHSSNWQSQDFNSDPFDSKKWLPSSWKDGQQGSIQLR